MPVLSNEHAVSIANAIISTGRDGGLHLAGYANDQAESYRNCCESIAQLLRDGIIDNLTATRAIETFRITQTFILQNNNEMGDLLSKQIVNAGLKAVGGVVNGFVGVKLFPE
jgi:hypothetical protein